MLSKYPRLDYFKTDLKPLFWKMKFNNIRVLPLSVVYFTMLVKVFRTAASSCFTQRHGHASYYLLLDVFPLFVGSHLFSWVFTQKLQYETLIN